MLVFLLRDIGNSVQTSTSQVESAASYVIRCKVKGQRILPVVIGDPSLLPIIPAI